jgi:hypothetical protein
MDLTGVTPIIADLKNKKSVKKSVDRPQPYSLPAGFPASLLCYMKTS